MIGKTPEKGVDVDVAAFQTDGAGFASGGGFACA